LDTLVSNSKDVDPGLGFPSPRLRAGFFLHIAFLSLNTVFVHVKMCTVLLLRHAIRLASCENLFAMVHCRGIIEILPA
jgi:hypothetical protein